MIKKYDDKIGFREFFSVIFIVVASMATDTTPIMFAKKGLNAAWMVPILSALFFMPSLSCIFSLLRLYKNKNLIDVIFHVAGKFFGYIFTIALILIVFEYTILSTREYADILGTMFYLKTPSLFILFLLIVTSCYIASRGFTVLGSLCWFVYPYMQVVILLLIPTIWVQMDFNQIFPIGGPGLGVLLKTSITSTTIYDTLLFLAVFFPKVRTYKEFKSATLWGLSISVLQIALYTLTYITVFGYLTFINMNYPFHQITRLVEIGRFITNTEVLYLGFWAIISSVRFSIFIYVIAEISTTLLKTNRKKTLIPLIGFIIFIIAILPENYTKYILIFRTTAIKYLWVYIAGLPILLWIIAKLKGEFKNEKD
ncbi:spore germination protein [Proteiniborus sp. DW1]|uniref:GerAB/ArcD/ProY family transporter n=1 Tax=Proteiniborus sp. DW1 TaxID=1889883 RepID=UPI00092DED4F|nr:endospore germination permease [Proteiniborus sp. DW1]SCG84272.1 spore germination protein [Proteiniborus sp. DW1]